MEEGESFSDFGVCVRCGKSFPNCKAWNDHRRSCYHQYNTRHGPVTVARSSSCCNDLEKEKKDDASLDLVSCLPGGWNKKREQGSFGASTTSSSASSILLQVGDGFNNSEPDAVKEPQEQSNVAKKFKFDAMEEEKNLEKPEEDENCFKKKLQKSSMDQGAVKQEEGSDHQQKCTCKQCGLEFDGFRGLGGHVSFHNKKKKGEEHEESKAKKNGKEAHQCDRCDKTFPTGQALGGHKRVHSNALHIRKFDLNQLPPEANFFAE